MLFSEHEAKIQELFKKVALGNTQSVSSLLLFSWVDVESQIFKCSNLPTLVGEGARMTSKILKGLDRG